MEPYLNTHNVYLYFQLKFFYGTFSSNAYYVALATAVHHHHHHSNSGAPCFIMSIFPLKYFLMDCSIGSLDLNCIMNGCYDSSNGKVLSPTANGDVIQMHTISPFAC